MGLDLDQADVLARRALADPDDSVLKCELSALWQDLLHKHGGRQAPEDMDEKTLGRTHLAGPLDAGFLLDPIEEGLDGLTHPRDGAGQPGISGIG